MVFQGQTKWQDLPQPKSQQEAPGWHLLGWLSSSPLSCKACCETGGQEKAGAPAPFNKEPAAPMTASRMRCDPCSAEACCRKSPPLGQDSRREDRDPMAAQVWDTRSKQMAKEEAAEQRSTQEPDPEQMSMHPEEQKTHGDGSPEVRRSLSEEELAEIRELLLNLSFDHRADSCAEEEVIPWVDQMLLKYPGLERELYTRLCGKYGEEPLGKFDARDDTARREGASEERTVRRRKPGDTKRSTSRSTSSLSALVRQGSSTFGALLGQAKQVL